MNACLRGILAGSMLMLVGCATCSSGKCGLGNRGQQRHGLGKDSCQEVVACKVAEPQRCVASTPYLTPAVPERAVVPAAPLAPASKLAPVPVASAPALPAMSLPEPNGQATAPREVIPVAPRHDSPLPPPLSEPGTEPMAMVVPPPPAALASARPEHEDLALVPASVRENSMTPVASVTPVDSGTELPIVGMGTGPTLTGSGHYAHADDYSWAQGRVQRVHSRGGYWVLRYAPIDQVDTHGGSFIVTGHLLPDIAEGDIVRIRGRVLERDTRLNGMEYRVTEMEMIQPVTR